MAYTYTFPTLTLPSGNLVISFYSTGTAGTTTSLSDTYITELDSLTKEVEIKGTELILNSINLSLWDKLGKFRSAIISDLKNGYDVKATFTLSGTVLFVGYIDKYSIEIEQKYLSISDGLVQYTVVTQSANEIPSAQVEVISFTIKDILGKLEDIDIKSLKDRLSGYLNLAKRWELVNGVFATTNQGDSWLISVKQLLRHIFYLLPSSGDNYLIKLGVQVEDNILSAMSHSFSDVANAYHIDNNTSGGTKLNVAINKAKGLDDLYLIFNTPFSGGGFENLFSEVDSTTTDSTTPKPESLFNYNNCLELVGKICFTFGLIPQIRYDKKSIHSISNISGGGGYAYSLISSTLLGGGGSNGLIYFLDTNSNGVLDEGYPTNNGQNYTSAPTITIAPPSDTGQATATTSVSSTLSTITGATITNSGSGYTTTPSVSIAAPPPPREPSFDFLIENVGATTGVITAIYVVDGGSGFRTDNLPSIDITKSSSGGTKATVSITTANISGGQIDSVTIVNGGSGYNANNPPTIYGCVPPTPIQATATATIDNEFEIVSGITITNGGSGYLSSSSPTITIAPPDISNQATATANLSDYDIYFINREEGVVQSLNTDILESSFNSTNESTIDEYNIGSEAYTQVESDTTNIKLTQKPKNKLDNNAIFGLSSWTNPVGAGVGQYSDNFLMISSQYEPDGTSDAILNNKYSIARHIHNNEQLFQSSNLADVTDEWTIHANWNYNTTGGVWSGYGKFYCTESNINNTTLIGNLTKTIIGQPLIFSCWIDSPHDNDCIVKVRAITNSGGVAATKNKSNLTYFNVKNSNNNYAFYSFALEPLDLKAEITTIELTFSGFPSSSSVIRFSSPMCFVGAETVSMWLANKYMNYFGRPLSEQYYTETLNRKYQGLVGTDINCGDKIIENGQVYYIKKIEKDLVENETTIEAINYKI